MRRMRAITRGAAVLAVLLLAGAPAGATRLAGLKLDPRGGPPGSALRVTGTWFATPADGFAELGPVRLRWGGSSGPLLAEVTPDAGGTFIVTVTVPADAPPGDHVLVASQLVTGRDGVVRAAPGTPAKAVFAVAGAPQPPARPAATSVAPEGDAGSGSLLLPVATAGLVLLLASAWLLARELGGRHHGVVVRGSGARGPARAANDGTGGDE